MGDAMLEIWVRVREGVAGGGRGGEKKNLNSQMNVSTRLSICRIGEETVFDSERDDGTRHETGREREKKGAQCS